ncbi:hypothetical protein GUI12_03000 [Anaplasmataceae bacterium AB001_6]|nr:hypothetical protein GUI12_03000 [Anaplasmataceae bacterium AB001_6]
MRKEFARKVFSVLNSDYFIDMLRACYENVVLSSGMNFHFDGNDFTILVTDNKFFNTNENCLILNSSIRDVENSLFESNIITFYVANIISHNQALAIFFESILEKMRNDSVILSKQSINLINKLDYYMFEDIISITDELLIFYNSIRIYKGTKDITWKMTILNHLNDLKNLIFQKLANRINSIEFLDVLDYIKNENLLTYHSYIAKNIKKSYEIINLFVNLCKYFNTYDKIILKFDLSKFFQKNKTLSNFCIEYTCSEILLEVNENNKLNINSYSVTNFLLDDSLKILSEIFKKKITVIENNLLFNKNFSVIGYFYYRVLYNGNVYLNLSNSYYDKIDANFLSSTLDLIFKNYQINKSDLCFINFDKMYSKLFIMMIQMMKFIDKSYLNYFNDINIQSLKEKDDFNYYSLSLEFKDNKNDIFQQIVESIFNIDNDIEINFLSILISITKNIKNCKVCDTFNEFKDDFVNIMEKSVNGMLNRDEFKEIYHKYNHFLLNS